MNEKPPHDYELPQPARSSWRAVRETFLREHYYALLYKYGLSLTCARCNTVYLDADLSLSPAGKISVDRIVTEKACGEFFPAALLHDFKEYLRKYPYPRELYGTTVRLRLGTGLKC